MKKIVSLCLLIFAVTGVDCSLVDLLYAGVPSTAGTAAAPFLKIGIGARAIGMGEGFTAIANDATATYWNPAGLTAINRQEISLSHNAWFQNINFEHIAYVLPAKQLKGVVGFASTYLYVNDMERRSGDTPQPEGTFGASDLSVCLSYGSSLNRWIGLPLRAGTNLKFIRQQIDDYVADAIAVDVGLMYPVLGNKVQAGLVVQNVGTPIKFISESYQLPLTYKIGLAWAPLNGDTVVSGQPFIIGLSLSKSIDTDYDFRVGTEYWFGGLFSVRAGYLHRNKTQSESLSGDKSGTISNREFAQLTGLTAGFGFRLSSSETSPVKTIGFDYAFVPYGELGNTHRFTMGMKF